MTYDITKAGTGLKIVAGDGTRYDIPEPVLDLYPTAVYPSTVTVLEIKSATLSVRISSVDIVTVVGSAGAGTLPGLFDQLVTIL